MKQWFLYALNIAIHIVICGSSILVPIIMTSLDLLIHALFIHNSSHGPHKRHSSLGTFANSHRLMRWMITMTVSCSSSFSRYSRCSANMMYYSASTSSVWLLKVEEMIDFIYFQESMLAKHKHSRIWLLLLKFDLSLWFPYDWRCNKELFVKRFQLCRNNLRTRQLKKSQGKRDRTFRQYKHYSILSSLLPSIETQIGNLQDEVAEIKSLKAERIWLEPSQKPPGFIKHLIKARGISTLHSCPVSS
jgi:hypothetical protein